MDTGKVYPSAVQADRAMGYPLNTIARAARLGYKTERKISWEYIQN